MSSKTYKWKTYEWDGYKWSSTGAFLSENRNKKYTLSAVDIYKPSKIRIHKDLWTSLVFEILILSYDPKFYLKDPLTYLSVHI